MNTKKINILSVVGQVSMRVLLDFWHNEPYNFNKMGLRSGIFNHIIRFFHFLSERHLRFDSR